MPIPAYNPNYHPSYQPSAPPYNPNSNRPAAPIAARTEPKPPSYDSLYPAKKPDLVVRTIDLTSNCTVCHYPLKNIPDSWDGRKVTAANPCNIGCGHALHKTCLEYFLSQPATNKAGHQCPECRTLIEKHKVTAISMNTNTSVPQAPRAAEQPQADEGSDLADLGNLALKGARGVLGGLAWIGRGVAAGIKSAFTDSPEDIKDRWASVATRIVKLQKRWDNFPNFFFKEQISNMKAACDTISNIRKGLSFESRKADEWVAELERITALFESDLGSLKSNLNADLRGFQKDVIKTLDAENVRRASA